MTEPIVVLEYAFRSSSVDISRTEFSSDVLHPTCNVPPGWDSKWTNRCAVPTASRFSLLWLLVAVGRPPGDLFSQLGRQARVAGRFELIELLFCIIWYVKTIYEVT